MEDKLENMNSNVNGINPDIDPPKFIVITEGKKTVTKDFNSEEIQKLKKEKNTIEIILESITGK